MLTKFSESLYLDVSDISVVQLDFRENRVDLHLRIRSGECYLVPEFTKEFNDAPTKLAAILSAPNSGSANSSEVAALTSALAARQVEIGNLNVLLAQRDAEIAELKERLAASAHPAPERPRDSKAWDLS